jgi:hypothetical protein
MKSWCSFPPGYGDHPQNRYPTVYFTHGFGGNLVGLRARYGSALYGRMKAGKMPPMIWVLLDESSPTGTHEFADGVNNGPWGTALTTELIPYLEQHYRMDAKTSGRFLQGHSSGGWATLWLQTTYPKIFGGTWPTSPDPSDFHAFSTIDLSPRMPTCITAQMAPRSPSCACTRLSLLRWSSSRTWSVLGDYGGQLGSFEWVFSPRGPDGRPLHMFDRKTGDVDPEVAAYWRDHYDISHNLQQNWLTLKPDLRGKIHLFVGTEDTFYLDGAAHLLQALLEHS